MYASVNFKTKKAFKDAVANGDKITVYQPNQMFASQSPPLDGKVDVEGPHYPKPHSWYANVVLKDGYIVSVK